MSVTGRTIVNLYTPPPYRNFPLTNYNPARKALLFATGPTLQQISFNPGELDPVTSYYRGGYITVPPNGIVRFSYALDHELVWQAWYTWANAGDIVVMESFDTSATLGEEVHMPEKSDWYRMYGLDENGWPLKKKAKRQYDMCRQIAELVKRIKG